MMNKKIIVTTLVLWTSHVFAVATTTQSEIHFDFKHMVILSSGVYNIKNEDDKNNGLNAEVNARKNGVLAFENYIQESCKNSNKLSLKIKDNWRNSFRSQGTEIYPNKTIVILLQANYKEIFQNSKKNNPKSFVTPDGQKIVFSLPEKISSKNISCGAIPFEYKNRTLFLIPNEQVTNPSDNNLIVSLVLNGNFLKLKNNDDAKILDSLSLLKDEKQNNSVQAISVLTGKSE